MFKLILTLLGFFWLGLLGALLGFFIGGSIDRAKSYGIGGINPLANAKRQEVFLATCFILMGKLAKSDGHVSQHEINHVEDFMRQMGMTQEHRQQAITQFKRGTIADDALVAEVCQEFMLHCGQTLHLRQTLLTYLIVIALADQQLDQAEEKTLEQIALHLSYPSAQFRQLLEMILNQAQFAQGRPASQSNTEEAYKALGVSTASSNQEVKRAYRKLMSQHHPDKLMGQGMPEDMIKVATERAKEIQAAYDLIKEQRPTLK